VPGATFNADGVGVGVLLFPPHPIAAASSRVHKIPKTAVRRGFHAFHHKGRRHKPRSGPVPRNGKLNPSAWASVVLIATVKFAGEPLAMVSDGGVKVQAACVGRPSQLNVRVPE
jgi:hypothetical protein